MLSLSQNFNMICLVKVNKCKGKEKEKVAQEIITIDPLIVES